MAQIGFDEVTKVYEDGTEAVRSVDLTIEDGTLMVLVGPSGCGKTTLLRMVAGLEEITGGSIRLGDAVINDVEAKNRDLAMVFQNYALYPHMTCYDNMAFGLKLRKVPRKEIDRRVRETARTLGLEDQLKKKPRALSGGQRQRVAMGRAIVREPQAFLMDEPLSNLDAKLRVQMRTEISRIQRDLGTTMIYVTHDQTEAMTMGDRVAVMNRGVLQQVDAPQEHGRRGAAPLRGRRRGRVRRHQPARARGDLPAATGAGRPGRQPGGAGHPAGGHRGSTVHQRPPGGVGHPGGRRHP
jgi:multiple sugar transport system ATP-binding protein